MSSIMNVFRGDRSLRAPIQMPCQGFPFRYQGAPTQMPRAPIQVPRAPTQGSHSDTKGTHSNARGARSDAEGARSGAEGARSVVKVVHSGTRRCLCLSSGESIEKFQRMTGAPARDLTPPSHGQAGDIGVSVRKQ